jgi:crotonobetainyl-CoA:carnitine CoA-transferase CaiB-like acyl-CoA transferase
MQHATGPMTLVASPLRLSATPPEYRSAPPLLGEHTNEVLSGVLALPADEIARLRGAGVI